MAQSTEAARMIRWLAMNRFNTPENQPSAEMQAILEDLPWNREALGSLYLREEDRETCTDPYLLTGE